MSNIKLIFKKEESKETLETSQTTGLFIIEKEGELPRAVAKFEYKHYRELKKFDTCEIFRDEKLFFKGDVLSISTDGTNMEIEFITHMAEIDIPPKEKDAFENDILTKFKNENPDIFVPIDINEFDTIGNTKKSPILKPETAPNIINDKIIDKSLKIKVDESKEVSDIELEVGASWLSQVSGDLDLTNKIANRFKSGKINTMTPEKLMDSWPGVFDRLPITMYDDAESSATYKTTSKTKYFIGSSKLKTEDNTKVRINIDEIIAEFSLNKTSFKHNLTLSWWYEQFMTETLKSTISNKFSNRKNVKKIKINLKNVQEYMDDFEAKTFFGSENGIFILGEILKGIGNYIALSMRNIEISLNVLLDDETLKFDCNTWLEVNGYKVKINQIEKEFSEFNNIIKIKAVGFEKILPSGEFIKIPEIPNPQDKILNPADIIHNITIYNDGGVQYEKLLKYISELKARKQISKENYKCLISKFLNENQTRISIIAKPLKTKHCEKREINIQQKIQFLGDE